MLLLLMIYNSSIKHEERINELLIKLLISSCEHSIRSELVESGADFSSHSKLFSQQRYFRNSARAHILVVCVFISQRELTSLFAPQQEICTAELKVPSLTNEAALIKHSASVCCR